MKSILLLSLLPALAAAAVGAGNGPGATPAQIALFGAANQHPNATGSVYLIGANMTEDPSTTLAFTEWTASVNVTEVPGSSLAPSGQVITNSVISFNSNGAFRNQSEWDTCVHIITDVARNATVNGQKDTGDCEATFGTNCTQAWIGAVQEARATAARRNGGSNYTNSACGDMLIQRIPDACQGYFGFSHSSGDVIDDGSMNGTMAASGGAFYFDNSEPHDPSNTTFYENAATRIWPVMLIQSPKNLHDNGAGFTHAGMSCLRATNPTQGSKAIGDVPSAAEKAQIV